MLCYGLFIQMNIHIVIASITTANADKGIFNAQLVNGTILHLIVFVTYMSFIMLHFIPNVLLTASQAQWFLLLTYVEYTTYDEDTILFHQ